MNFIFWLSWKYKLSKYPANENLSGQPLSLSVVVAVRNESGNIKNLLYDLQNQTLSKSKFEVIIVDDHSVDDTVDQVLQYKSLLNIDINLLELPGDQQTKKAALQEGIASSKGNIIVTTDGDCRLPSGWLETYYNYFKSGSVVMLSGPVTFSDEEGIFQKLQTIEFSSLIGSGAATLGLKFASMCNGANLAFKKEAYLQTKGYAGYEKTVSGDDQTILYKLMTEFPGRVKFLKDKKVIIKTKAKATIKEFYFQRRRWAGKWRYNKNLMVALLAVLVFTFNLNILIAAALAIAGKYSVSLFLCFFIVKFLSEFVFLASVNKFLGNRLNAIHFIILQIFYPIYIVLFGLAANAGKFEWKGRKFEK